MTGPELLSQIITRFAAHVANHPWFWLAFASMLVAITAAVMQAFARRWLRTAVATVLAIQCFALCSSDWLA